MLLLARAVLWEWGLRDWGEKEEERVSELINSSFMALSESSLDAHLEMIVMMTHSCRCARYWEHSLRFFLPSPVAFGILIRKHLPEEGHPAPQTLNAFQLLISFRFNTFIC